jgi:hypothetical protein
MSKTIDPLPDILPDGRNWIAISALESYGGEGGIRTPGRVFDPTTV